MVFSPDFLKRVTECLEEILVGIEDGAIEREFDHGLRLTDRGDLSLVVGIKALLVCNVAGKFHDLAGLSLSIKDRVVARLNPNLAAALTNSLVLTRIKFTASELLPERAILRALAVGRRDEHRMVFSSDFLERV